MANEDERTDREEEKALDERSRPSAQGQSPEQGQAGQQGQFASQGQAATGQASESGGGNDTALSERSESSPEQPSSLPDHEQGAMGGSVTAAGGGSEGPGAGSAGIERSSQEAEGGFVGSQEADSGEYLQQDRKDQPNQGGFAEQGRGAPEASGPEGTGERDANKDSDIEGSSNS